MSDLDERIDKLPKWAQSHIGDLNTRIRVLEASREESEAALTAGPEDSDVFAEMSDVSRPLGKGVEIRFGSGASAYTVAMRDGALHIDVTGDLVIEPQSTFEVVVRQR